MWIILVLALVLMAVGGRSMLGQLKGGLAETGLHDKFTWGLYIQGFFFFSALAGGVLVLLSLAALFEAQALKPLLDQAAALALGCLAAAGLMIGADLGKPFRSLKIATAFQVISPMTWDFYFVSLCGLLNLIYVLGLVPVVGGGAKVWGALGLFSALGFIMVHTLFFLSRVEAGFHSAPFMALDVLMHSLWGGAALVALATGGGGSTLLFCLTLMVLVLQLSAYLASSGVKRKGHIEPRLAALNLLILIILFLSMLLNPSGGLRLRMASLLILVSVYLDKAHLVRVFQNRPTLPKPYSQFEDNPVYKPSKSEWMLAGGGLGVFLAVSSVVLLLQRL